MTREIAGHLEAIGSEIEQSLMSYDDHMSVSNALEDMTTFVRNIAEAKKARLAGHIVKAVRLEAYAQRAYDRLPKGAQW